MTAPPLAPAATSALAASAPLIVAVVAGLALVVVGAFTAWAQLRTSRRTAAGTISTSSADILWQANQNLIETLQAENGKLIQQRDRLVGLMDEKIAPALAGIDEALKRDGTLLANNSRMMADLYAMVDGLRSRLEGGGHEAVANTP